MAPKKKKQPKNAFYYFLMDFKENAEKSDRSINSLELDMEADIEWRNLDPERRAHYENIAAERRRKIDNLENKFTTTGVSYAQLHREQMARNRQKEIMINEIESTVRSLTASTLKHKVFHFIHVNYYCRLLDGHFLPCEIGISKFTFQDGVKDCYHTIVNLECIPTGYFLECQKNSEQTHQIPLPPENTLGERDNEKILVQIKAFLSENDTFPPVYTLQSNIEAAQDTLTTFALGEDLFRVYPISKLLFELRNACAFQVGGVGFPVESLAEREFEKDFFNLSPGISCDYHEGMDACQYCSLSIVKRWCYLFASLGCGDLGITLQEGSHKPRKVTLPPAPPEPMIPKTQVSQRKNKKGAPVVEPPPITIIDYSTKPSPEQKGVLSHPDIDSSPLAQFGTYIRANATDRSKSESVLQKNSVKNETICKKSVINNNTPVNNLISSSSLVHYNHNKSLHSHKSEELEIFSSAPGKEFFPDATSENHVNKLSCLHLDGETTHKSTSQQGLTKMSNFETQLGTFNLETAAKLVPPPTTIPHKLQHIHSEVKKQIKPKLASQYVPGIIGIDSQPLGNYYEDPHSDLYLHSVNASGHLDYVNTDIMKYENNYSDQYTTFIYDYGDHIAPQPQPPQDDFDVYIENAFQPISEEENDNNEEICDGDISISQDHLIPMTTPLLSLRQPYGFETGIGHGRGITVEGDTICSQPGRGNLCNQPQYLRQPWTVGQQFLKNGDVLSTRFHGRSRGRARSLSFFPG